MYSVVHDWASKLPQEIWDRPRFDEYNDLIRRLKIIDDQLGLPDCNPNKGEFLEQIEKRLRSIEEKLKIEPPK